MSDSTEVRQFALNELDQRYAMLRLQSTEEGRQAMTRSLSRYGQISPLVVWPAGDAWVLIDGFKRVEAARQVPGLDTLGARLIDADSRTAKAAIYGLNRLSHHVHLLEEAWIVCALVREATGGLTRSYDPRLSVAGNRLARRLAMLLEGLARMENWLRHSGRAELSPRDGELLRGGLERWGRDGHTVAELSAELARELS